MRHRVCEASSVGGGRPEADAFVSVAPYYDYLMRSVPYRHWADYVDRLFLRCRTEPELVLDLCCGTGRFGLELARKGYTMVGADLSEAMVRGAVANAAEALIDYPVIVADACALPFDGGFDAVVSVFDSLNNITWDGGLLAAFRSAHRALVPGGWFIFDLNTIRALEEELFTQSRIAPSELLHYHWVSHWDPETRLSTIEMEFLWRDCDPPQTFREVHVQRGHTEEEVLTALREAGFRTEAAYDAYSFARATARSTRTHFVARKL